MLKGFGYFNLHKISKVFNSFLLFSFPKLTWQKKYKFTILPKLLIKIIYHKTNNADFYSCKTDLNHSFVELTEKNKEKDSQKTIF